MKKSIDKNLKPCFLKGISKKTSKNLDFEENVLRFPNSFRSLNMAVGLGQLSY